MREGGREGGTTLDTKTKVQWLQTQKEQLFVKEISNFPRDLNERWFSQMSRGTVNLQYLFHFCREFLRKSRALILCNESVSLWRFWQGAEKERATEAEKRLLLVRKSRINSPCNCFNCNNRSLSNFFLLPSQKKISFSPLQHLFIALSSLYFGLSTFETVVPILNRKQWQFKYLYTSPVFSTLEYID